jgi:hypothetical protein
MDYTGFGNYHCQECGHAMNDLVNRPSEWKPVPQDFGKQEGWICPVCGRGMAPWVDYCPCQINRNITWASGTGTSTYSNLDIEFKKYATTDCEDLKL